MKNIVMKKEDVAKEHKKLIPILRHGTKKQLSEEAKEQTEEMKGYGIKISPAYYK